MKRYIKSYWIYLPILWFLLGFIILPLINTIVSGFANADGSYGLQNYFSFIGSPSGFETIKNTLLIGVFTVISCGILGTLLAFLINMVDFKHKKIYKSLLMSPIMIPGVIIVIAYIQLYGGSGLITTFLREQLPLNPPELSGFWGILLIHSLSQYIYFFTNVSVALKYVDRSQIEAARGFGAGKIKIFSTIILPEIAPALFSSALITFISAISSFSAPNLIGGGIKVLSTQIMYSKTNGYLNIASMQVSLLLIMGLSVLVLMRYYEAKYEQERGTKAVPYDGIKLKTFKSNFLHRFLLISFIAVIVFPIIATIYLSFVKSNSIMTDIFPSDFSLENYSAILQKKRVLKPFINSIGMTLLSVFAALAISVPIAYLSVKRKNKFTRAVELLAMISMSIPVGSIAINLITSFNRANFFAFGNSLIGTYIILPIAYVILALPILLRSNIISIEKFNTDLEYAAKSLGARKFTLYRRILLPLLAPAIMSGSIIMFIRLVGEYNLSAFLYGIHNVPISIAMVGAVQEFNIGLAMSYGSITIAISFIGLALAEYLGELAMKYRV